MQHAADVIVTYQRQGPVRILTEEDFMLDLQHQLLSAPAQDSQRDFPLRTFPLGRFSVTHGAERIRFARKTQRRPLQLLKALIAHGGRDIATDRLGLALWPETASELGYT